MTDQFDKDYWDEVWAGTGEGDRAASMADNPPNPHLVREVAGLRPGTALEAGCGGGAEAIWLASQGWQVTAVDIAAEALERAALRAAGAGLGDRILWQRADLSTWEPSARFDLVTTHYAHPSIPQLDFYARIAEWVEPGGTLFIVGHLHRGDHGHGLGPGDPHGLDVQHAHGHDAEHAYRPGGDLHHHDARPPAEASVTAAAISQRLDAERWEVVTAEEVSRHLRGPTGHPVTVHDVVVRVARRG